MVIKKYSYLLRSLLIFLSFIFLLFPMGKYVAFDNVLYTFDGIELIFGYKSEKNVILGFNFAGLLMFILLLSGMIAPMFYQKTKKYGLIGETIGVLLACVFYFLLPVFVVHKSTDIKNIFHVLPLVYIGGSVLLIALLLCVYELFQLKGARKWINSLVILNI